MTSTKSGSPEPYPEHPGFSGTKLSKRGRTRATWGALGAGCHLPGRVGARGRLGASHRGAGDWGRGDLRVALALSLAEGRRQPRAQWGSAGRLPSTSWIAARGARRKRPALVVKGFLSEAIRPRLLAAGSPLGRAEARPRPWGRAWRRAVPGSRTARTVAARSLRGKLTGKSPSWHRAARHSGPAGDEAQGPNGTSFVPGGATTHPHPGFQGDLLHVPHRWPCCLSLMPPLLISYLTRQITSIKPDI